MRSAFFRAVCALGLLGVGAAVMADTPKNGSPQEPVGFISGAVIGAFAGGPVGAVIGAGIGTWVGNRVHRAGEAAGLAIEVAALKTEKAALTVEGNDLSASDRVVAARSADEDAMREDALRAATLTVLDGLQGDVLFRTGSAEVAPEMAAGIQTLAESVAKSPTLKVRIDGHTDPRGTVAANLKLSAARANAVRQLFLAAGVGEEAIEVNAHGTSPCVAGDSDSDSYALARRVRFTLQSAAPAAIAQAGRGVADAGASHGRNRHSEAVVRREYLPGRSCFRGRHVPRIEHVRISENRRDGPPAVGRLGESVA